jgi:hypothetical protein
MPVLDTLSSNACPVLSIRVPGAEPENNVVCEAITEKNATAMTRDHSNMQLTLA